MALIYETGIGLSNAESFCSVAFADSHHTARGREATWENLDDEVKEQALRRATDYLEQSYRLRWRGCRVSETQALSWPRYDVPYRDSSAYYDSDSVPVEVKRACAELAFRALSEDLAPDIAPEVTSKTVGPVSVTYAPGSRRTKKFAAIDMLLAPLLRGSGITITRA